MKNVVWHFPEHIEKVPDMLKKHKVFLHGGGTHLTGNRLTNNAQLISLDKLDLDFVKKEEGAFQLGAQSTYQTVVDELSRYNPEHILVKALSGAATLPLRNRITLGGSLFLSPGWSDLPGPLTALDAQVHLFGENQGTYPVSEFIQRRELKKDSIITKISFPDIPCKSRYYRECITKNDHPAFTLSILKFDKDIRIVLTGHTDRVYRAKKVEEAVKKASFQPLQRKQIDYHQDIHFAPVKGMTPGYIRHLAETATQRELAEILKE